MGTQQGGAVGVSGAQREIHAALDVVRPPVHLAVDRDRFQRAGEGAVGVAAARPDMPLVDMGVHVDEARPGHAAVEVEFRQPRAPAGRVDALDQAVADGDVGADQAVVIGRGGEAVDQYRRQRRVGEDVARLSWNPGEAPCHASPSCPYPSFPDARRFRATS